MTVMQWEVEWELAQTQAQVKAIQILVVISILSLMMSSWW
jgi:hypothetical protein